MATASRGTSRTSLGQSLGLRDSVSHSHADLGLRGSLRNLTSCKLSGDIAGDVKDLPTQVPQLGLTFRMRVLERLWHLIMLSPGI